MANIIINKDEAFLDQMNKAIGKNKNLTDWELFKLNYQMKKATIAKDFNELKVLSYLPHVNFLDHQVDTAKTVIQEMNGRAILADEVGLGKTIEAGLILKEYMIRGLVKNALLLVPASLVNQWITELHEKFYIPAASYRKNYNWDDHPIFVTSIDMAKRDPHRENILKLNFDMVIIDEAHKLKNHKTLNYSFARSLKKKYCLLLTATPVQNKIIEVFNLVSILKPGYLGSYESFIERFGKKTVDNLEDTYLNKLIQKVMVRNLRKDTLLKDVERNIHSVWLTFSKEEQKVYDQLHDLFDSFTSLSKITFLRELCSSREACYLSLQNSKNEQIKAASEEIMNEIAMLPHHTKAKKLVELIQEIGDEKIIVFTEYRASQYYLQWYLQQHNITSVAFRGGLKRGRKDWIRQLFKNNAQVFLATEAGGEGINLQFCKYIINYDLPWNPMRLEQRIGRIHRFGQDHNIHIYNFAIENTIEEHIMKLLYEKIDVFERVIGKLDKILATLQIDSMENEFMQIMDRSTSVGEMKIKLDNFVSVIHDLSDDKRDEENYG
ncbi:DEAD/DEAH box helicase [Pseudogracilibacillus sp. SO30301A]|uniref:DEAD/DEAH box helicase n=1 Tax=Pseudogracilibacillus sp. SO30301A TaxID=3098291 RepID=UPI00300E699E